MDGVSGLTSRQAGLLNYIVSYVDKTHGVSPSFQDMKQDLGYKSKASIHRLMQALKERGHISYLPRQARSIQLLKPSPEILKEEARSPITVKQSARFIQLHKLLVQQFTTVSGKPPSDQLSRAFASIAGEAALLPDQSTDHVQIFLKHVSYAIDIGEYLFGQASRIDREKNIAEQEAEAEEAG
jgi:LexA DNA binding domain